MSSSIKILHQTRLLTYKVVKRLSPEQMLAMPEPFDNNIAWNIGHMISVQESLIYWRNGLKGPHDQQLGKLYRPDTSPADWSSPPDLDQLKELLLESPKLLETDYKNGRFENFEAFKSRNFDAENVDEALAFNNFHEGLHFGTILALLNSIPK